MQEFNIIVANKYALENADIGNQLFGGEDIHRIVPEEWDIYDILIHLEIFKSKSEARKNWTRTGKEIPPGYNEFKDIGKQKRALYIWNPIGINEGDLIDSN